MEFVRVWEKYLTNKAILLTMASGRMVCLMERVLLPIPRTSSWKRIGLMALIVICSIYDFIIGELIAHTYDHDQVSGEMSP